MPIAQFQPYLLFDGRCDEALTFYQRALGAEVTMLMRYKESPDPTMCPPGAGDKVMHSTFRVGDAVAMASDGRNEGAAALRGVRPVPRRVRRRRGRAVVRRAR